MAHNKILHEYIFEATGNKLVACEFWEQIQSEGSKAMVTPYTALKMAQSEAGCLLFILLAILWMWGGWQRRASGQLKSFREPSKILEDHYWEKY